MYCYDMAIKDKPRGYRKRMLQLWIERQNFECTEQRLCDQKKQIIDKNLLTTVEIDEVKIIRPDRNIMTKGLKKNRYHLTLTYL